MISDLNPRLGTKIRENFFDWKFLYPGEAINWTCRNNNYLLYAKGKIVDNSDTTIINAFSGIRNYEFHIKRQMNGVIEDKILYRWTFTPLIPFNMKEALIYIG
ncbi:MAG: hypothetical protein R2759_07150 [Bacteroidales bacterium]